MQSKRVEEVKETNDQRSKQPVIIVFLDFPFSNTFKLPSQRYIESNKRSLVSDAIVQMSAR